MTTTTEEAVEETHLLDVQPIGATFVIEGQPGQTWTKTSEGRWWRDGLTSVPARFFIAYLRAGRIMLTSPTPVVSEQEMAAMAVDLAAPVAVTRVVEVIPDALKETLIAWGREEHEDSGFWDMLSRHGIEAMDTLTVRVNATGRSQWTPTIEMAGTLWPGLRDASVTDVEDYVTVLWSKEFTVTREVRPGACACDEVAHGDSDVVAQLPDDHDGDYLELATYCDNDND